MHVEILSRSHMSFVTFSLKVVVKTTNVRRNIRVSATVTNCLVRAAINVPLWITNY